MARLGTVLIASLFVVVSCGGGLSAEERPYLDRVKATREVIGDSVGHFGALLSEIRVTETWRADIRQETALWTAAYNDARRQSVPEGMETLHDRHVAVLALLAGAADDFNPGIGDRDQRRIDEGTEKLEDAGTVGLQVARLIQRAEDEA